MIVDPAVVFISEISTPRHVLRRKFPDLTSGISHISSANAGVLTKSVKTDFVKYAHSLVLLFPRAALFFMFFALFAALRN